MFISGVNDTGDKLFGGVNDTADKFIGGVVTDFLWSAVSLIPAINLSPVLLTPLKNDRRWQRLKSKKFIAGVNDTAEKLFTGVNDTADKFLSGVNNTSH